MKLNEYFTLREKYPDFIYNSCDYSICGNRINIGYSFRIPGLSDFSPKWNISFASAGTPPDDGVVRELVFSLGMVELISYWKITCSPNVYINCGALSDNAATWWKKLYFKGLGEFFYTNGIEAAEDFMRIIAANKNQRTHIGVAADFGSSDKLRVLVPVGGGKDSAVTLELLRDDYERYSYVINPREACIGTIRAAGILPGSEITANRTLDENMLRLNREGYLNGHTPFSALVAFSSVLAAYLSGIPYAALSNESSANEPTVQGADVNHQYSKSFEFESDFIAYEKEYIGSGVSYFSLLRPLTELKIAELFSRYEKYRDVFRSCNAGSKTDSWCHNCAKCLFVYIILSPFLPRSMPAAIFGSDMLSDISLAETLEKLAGIVPEKPFECVGSRSEVNAALQTLIRQHEKSGDKLPALLLHYKSINTHRAYDINEILNSFDEANAVPETFIQIIKQAYGG